MTPMTCETATVRPACSACGVIPWTESDICPGCGRNNANYLDVISNACTAFRTMADFERSMNTGYIPSIYQDTRRKRLLTRILRARGYRVYDGIRVK